MTPLTPQQISVLNNLNTQGNYAEAYRYLRDIVRSTRNESNTPERAKEIENLQNWLDSAAKINSNDGSFVSEIVRGSTIGYGESIGVEINEAKFQEVSDKLAKDVIETVVNNNGIPDSKVIIAKDVSSAVNGLGLPPWGWAGTLFDQLPIWANGLGDDYQSFPKGIPWQILGWEMGQSLAANIKGFVRWINSGVSDLFNNAKKWQPRRDPLTFDLNGNGLDTVGINTTNPLMFDHDGDGIKTSSGWVKADDGFLVLDRNGNSMIDNGKELFGDATPLNAGGKAVDGFAALAQEDTNADGKVDQSDAKWAQLRIWRDFNQDGQSQSNELFTLASLNITSIKVAKEEHSLFLPNGNEIADLGSYTKTDGSIGAIGEVGKVADINLAQDTFTSHFTDTIPLAAGVSVLPKMSGSGVVRNLQEAASLDTDAGRTLKAKLEAFTAATTYTAQRALLNDLIIAWGATGNLTTSTIINQNAEDAQRFNTLEKFNGVTIFTQTDNVSIEDGRKLVLDEAWQTLADSIYQSLLTQTRFRPLLDQIDLVIDAAGPHLDLTKVTAHFQQLMTTVSVDNLGDLIEFNRLVLSSFEDPSWPGYYLLENVVRTTPLTPEITQIYKDVGIYIDASQFTATAGVLKNTIVVGRNSDDVINAGSGTDLVFGGAGNDVINGGSGDDYIDGGAGNDILQGGLGNDTYVWGKGAGNDRISNYDNTPGRFDIIIMNSNTKPEDVSIFTSWRDLRIKIKGTNEILLIGDGANRYGINENVMVNEIRFSDGTIWNTAKIKALALTGTDGDDSIEGFESDDIINGGAGNDVISGWGGNDILNGGAGNDCLGGGEGDDILDGGEGDDELSGMEGNDTIIWGKGSGSDSIQTNETFENDSLDGVDTIKIKVGTLPSDIKVKFINFNLILMATDGSSLTLINILHMEKSDVSQVVFEDGTTWDVNKLKLMAIAGDETSQTITGYNSSDIINAGGGNDIVYGLGGDDSLFGDAGYDTLYGGDGNDNLDAGADGGTLVGGQGDDNYFWGRGDGNVTIDNTRENSSPHFDRLILKAGVKPSDLLVRFQYGVNFRISFKDSSSINGGPNGTLDLSNQISNGLLTNYAINEVLFDDGTIWDSDTLRLKAIEGTEFNDAIEAYTTDDIIRGFDGNDSIKGKAGNDTIFGDAGNDYLYGEEGNDLIDGGDGNDWLNGGDGNDNLSGGDGDDDLRGDNGDDVLDGGSGNDYLYGGTGSDTFYWGAGSGKDRISTKYFASEINDKEVLIVKSGLKLSNLILTRVENDLLIKSGLDELRIYSHFSTSPINEIRFVDDSSVILTPLEIKELTKVVLIGTDGPDRLIGTDGNDVLDGKLGFDILNGGAGSDTYIFGRNSGFDTIEESADLKPNVDIVQFEADILPSDVRLIRHDGSNSSWDHENSSDLLIRINESSTGLVIKNYFENSTSKLSNKGIELIKFADGTTWDINDVYSKLMISTEQSDYLFGTELTDNIHGGGGDDVIYGNGGNDILNGGDGNDRLYGGGGDDILDGGNGDDSLSGALGFDQYKFGRNSGNDLIDGGDDSEIVQRDRIVLEAGIVPSDITLSREGAEKNYLLISIAGSTSTLKISSYFEGIELNAWMRQEILFADGTLWNAEQIKVLSTPAPNRSPVVSQPLLDQTANQNIPFSFAIPSATFSDPDLGDVLSYSATLSNNAALPSWLKFNASTKTFSGTSTSLGTLSVKVTVKDKENLAVSDIFDISTTTINRTPVVASPLVDQTANTGTAFTYTVPSTSFTDPDAGDTLTYTATLANGSALPAWLTFNASTRKLSGTPTSAATLSVKVTAKDTGNLTASDIFDVVVNVPNLTLNGTSAANTLTGGDGNDTLNGLGGNDKLIGGAGNDLIDGGTGNDTMIGGLGNDTYIVDSTSDVVTENVNEGIDQVKSSVTYTLIANLESLLLTGTSAINGTGNTLDNLLIGNSGKNTLNGAAGNDILQGMAGDDTLTDTLGNNIFDGGSGIDIITAGSGNDFIAGGIGNDTITTGTGADVIAFNRGDGMDTLNASTGKDNTISLGKGIKYADLLFKKSGNNLILVTGTNEQITLKDWYANTNNRSVANLQVVIEGTSDYNAASTNKLNNKKSEQFNFDGLVTKFDQARIANPSLTSWALSSSLLEFYLAGSDTAALGGDLAYQYAKNGNLSNFSMTPAHAIMVGGFGTGNQVLQATSSLRDASINLA